MEVGFLDPRGSTLQMAMGTPTTHTTFTFSFLRHYSKKEPHIYSIRAQFRCHLRRYLSRQNRDDSHRHPRDRTVPIAYHRIQSCRTTTKHVECLKNDHFQLCPTNLSPKRLPPTAIRDHCTTLTKRSCATAAFSNASQSPSNCSPRFVEATTGEFRSLDPRGTDCTNTPSPPFGPRGYRNWLSILAVLAAKPSLSSTLCVSKNLHTHLDAKNPFFFIQNRFIVVLL